MKQIAFGFALFFAVMFAIFASASDYSGDGTYTVKNGDIITLNNGWKITINGIVFGPTSEQIRFSLTDPSGTSYPQTPFDNSLYRIDGKKKFGSDEDLIVEVELIGLQGERRDISSGNFIIYEQATIAVKSIFEQLPKSAGGFIAGQVNETNKTLTLKNGKRITLRSGEKIIYANGYAIEFSRKFLMSGRWPTAVFNLYAPDGSQADNNIFTGDQGFTNVAGFPFIIHTLNDYSIDLTYVDGWSNTFATGWNLFSIPITNEDGQGVILESTCNSALLWLWNSTLQDYEKIGILEEGTRIPSNMGIWAKIQTKSNTVSDDDCKIIVSGNRSVTLQGSQLQKGWNLIGSPMSAYGQRKEFEDGSGSNFILRTFDDIKGSCNFEKGPWAFAPMEIADNGRGKFTKPFENRIGLGLGYFVKVNEECTFS